MEQRHMSSELKESLDALYAYCREIVRQEKPDGAFKP